MVIPALSICESDIPFSLAAKTSFRLVGQGIVLSAPRGTVAPKNGAQGVTPLLF